MKKVLVTGGARGLGKSICHMFDKHGYMVIINYNHSEADAIKLRDELNNALIYKADVSNEEEVKDMFDAIKKDVGNIDCIINNAGICKDNILKDKDSDEFLSVLKTNLVGTFLVCKYGSKLINEGNIVNVVSNNIYNGSYIESVDYDASKAGLISLSNNLANYLAPYVRVNTICPGWINTNMNRNLDKEFINKEENKILLGRFGNPNEVAELVFFLVSDNASYINNSIIRIDGGKKC